MISHPLVLALLVCTASQHDEKAPVRGWGREYVASGVTIQNEDTTDHYSVGYCHRAVDGRNEVCVQLTIRKAAFGPEEKQETRNLIFPISELREIKWTAKILAE